MSENQNKDVVVNTVVDAQDKFRDASLETPKHEFGRLAVGTLAAYFADKAARKAYDAAVLAYRAHRSA